MKVLTEARAIEIIREEWEKKLERIIAEADEVHLKPSGEMKNKAIIVVGTDVKRAKTGDIFTVKSISDEGHHFILKRADGKLARVSKEKFEKEFVLP